jgi:hypothetical protein
MLASFPASMVNQRSPDLGIPNRFSLNSSGFSTPIVKSADAPAAQFVEDRRAASESCGKLYDRMSAVELKMEGMSVQVATTARHVAM